IPIPTPITIEATTSNPAVQESETLNAIYHRVSNLEKEVKELKNIDPSSALLATIKYEVLMVVKEYIGTSLDDALHKLLQRHSAKFIKEHSVLADVIEVLKQQQKPYKSVEDIRKIKMEHAAKQQESQYTITSSDKAALKEFDQKITLFKTMTKSKSFDRNPKHRALYHALMESILENEDVMDKGVADKLKKRKLYDIDKDEDPLAGPDQGLKRKKTSKDTEPSKKTVFEAGDTQLPHNLREGMGKTDEPPIVKADPKEWFKKPERPPTPDPKWNTGKNSTSHWRSKRQTFYGYASNRVSKHNVYSTKRILAVTNVKINKWYGYGHLEEIEDMLLLVVQNKLFNLNSDVIVNLAVELRMFTRRIVIQKSVEDLQLGIESYQKKLNISKPRTRDEDLSQRAPYTTLSDPQGVIYED
ncbi:hypothetical protein Tco_1286703, partial [Tanacetum coccineum]